MEKEEQLLRKRILELAELSYQRDIPTHTDFLNLNEQTIFHSLARSMADVRQYLYGGYELAERKVVCFLPSYMDKNNFVPPVSCLRIAPVHEKFAQSLTHRDYLGAVMSLGIDRCKTGDILLDGNQAYLFCMEDLAEYIAGGLSSIRHTSVSVEIQAFSEISISPSFETIEGSIASLRLDNVLALAYKSSRGKIVPYIEGERVFINGKLAASNSASLKEGDIVSVRGLGRFRFKGIKNETKKGRIFVALDKYC